MKKLLLGMCLLGSFSALAVDCRDGLEDKFALAQKDLAELGIKMIEAKNLDLQKYELLEIDSYWVVVKYTLRNGIVLRLNSLLSPYQKAKYGVLGDFIGYKCELSTEKNNLVWLVNDETNIKLESERFKNVQNWEVKLVY